MHQASRRGGGVAHRTCRRADDIESTARNGFFVGGDSPTCRGRRPSKGADACACMSPWTALASRPRSSGGERRMARYRKHPAAVLHGGPGARRGAGPGGTERGSARWSAWTLGWTAPPCADVVLPFPFPSNAWSLLLGRYCLVAWLIAWLLGRLVVWLLGCLVATAAPLAMWPYPSR